MLRKPDKIFEKVQAHIIECLGYHRENATVAERLQNVVTDFRLWWDEEVCRRHKNKDEAFFEYSRDSYWLRLKTSWGDRKAALQEWYEWTDDEASRYCRETVDFLYCLSTYIQFLELCWEYNIEF